MFKSIFKVLYIGFGIIMALLVYIAGYNTNAFNYIADITAAAIETDYVEVAKIHGGCFEAKDMAKDTTPSLNTNNYEIAAFKSGTLITEDFYISDSDTTTENEYDYSYYVYLFGLTEVLDQTTDGTNVINETAFIFIGSEGQYKYYFKVSELYNPTYYIAKPKSLNEALLGNERDLFSNQTNWGFVNLTLTKTLVEAMNIGTIEAIQVTNTSGNVVFEQSITLDFNNETGFFKEIEPLVVNYNEYISNVTGDATNAEITEAETKFNDFYLAFEETFLSNPNNSFRHEDSYLQPGKLVWKTIGLLCFYLLAASILYVLIFNFAMIKKLFVRNSYNDSYGQRAVIKNAKAANTIDAEIKEIDEITKTNE